MKNKPKTQQQKNTIVLIESNSQAHVKNFYLKQQQHFLPPSLTFDLLFSCKIGRPNTVIAPVLIHKVNIN